MVIDSANNHSNNSFVTEDKDLLDEADPTACIGMDVILVIHF